MPESALMRAPSTNTSSMRCSFIAIADGILSASLKSARTPFNTKPTIKSPPDEKNDISDMERPLIAPPQDWTSARTPTSTPKMTRMSKRRRYFCDKNRGHDNVACDLQRIAPSALSADRALTHGGRRSRCGWEPAALSTVADIMTVACSGV